MLLAAGRIGRIGVTQREGATSPLASLFANGEDGFLFANFADPTRLFTLYSGPPLVAADNDPVGLALDQRPLGTVAENAAGSPELRGTGAIALVGTAPAATYDTSTGVGSASRAADGANQSSVTFAVSLGDVYLIDITPLQAVFVRDTATGALTHTFLSSAGRQQMAVRPATSTLFFQSANNNTTANFTIHSIKRLPGKHAAQSTAAARALWRANAGKPYIQTDGVNDNLGTSYVPEASGTVAVAFRSSALGVLQLAIGGGAAAGNKRCRMGVDGTGRALFIFNGSAGGADVTVSGDRTNTNMVLIMTWNPSGRELYLDGALVLADTLVALFDGAGSGYRLGSGEGSADVLNGRLYAALALNRRVTPSEVTRITSDFQRTFD